jgi:uncharacterized protein with PIN domain
MTEPVPRSCTKAEPHFIADCHLGKLAKYLRFMGYDTLYFSHIEDDNLVDLAKREARTILTRDRELSQRKNAPVFYLEPIDLGKQLRIVARRFDLAIRDDGYRRCLVCNARLQTIDKRLLSDEIPKRVRRHFDFFQQCPSCGRIYWQGDHYRNMMAFLRVTLEPGE